MARRTPAGLADDESPFEPEPGADFVWMIHTGGTVPAQFPAASVDGWKGRGWSPCRAPVEIDPALIERNHPAATAAAPTTESATAAATEEGVNERA